MDMKAPCWFAVLAMVLGGCGKETPPPSGRVQPRLLDLGSKQCIPCKKMAPILEELRQEYEGRFRVDFVDVWLPENKAEAEKHGIKNIPTQIFFDASGREVFRHEGFYSREEILAKWKELGFDFGAAAGAEVPLKFERLEPAKADARPKEAVCNLCDGDIVSKTLVVVKSAKGDVRLCCPHCYFILYSCLTEDKTEFEKRVSVTDWATGNAIPATQASYLAGVDEKSGRPWIRAFADREAAMKERQAAGGDVFGLAALQGRELSFRCGFCDRACYPADAARVICAGVQTWGCCCHCAMGVAARTGKDIEVYQKDRLTGEMIVVRTEGPKVVSLEPETAVAWFGLRKKPDGTYGSAGCFHQGFFTTFENLKTWVERNPTEGGKMISIQQALTDKLKMTPQQIQKACKIGECAPK